MSGGFTEYRFIGALWPSLSLNFNEVFVYCRKETLQLWLMIVYSWISTGWAQLISWDDSTVVIFPDLVTSAGCPVAATEAMKPCRCGCMVTCSRDCTRMEMSELQSFGASSVVYLMRWWPWCIMWIIGLSRNLHHLAWHAFWDSGGEAPQRPLRWLVSAFAFYSLPYSLVPPC